MNERTRGLARRYLLETHAFWDASRPRQADKLQQLLGELSARERQPASTVVDRVLGMATDRIHENLPPAYVSSIGGAGSHWLAGMIAELGDFADAGEVYFPRALHESFQELTALEQRYVVDSIHLLHAWALAQPELTKFDRCRIINCAQGPERIEAYKALDPACVTIHLYRDPRDRVLSVVYRKPEFRSYEAPAATDEEYLRAKCWRTRSYYEHYRALRKTADFECAYEELRSNTVRVLSAIAALLGVELPEMRLADIAYRHSADNIRRGVVPRRGNLDEGGVAQRWVESTSSVERRLMHVVMSDCIEGLGYELGDCFGFPVPALGRRGPRTLPFPDDKPVGVVHVRPHDGGAAEWRTLGPARGSIRVPSGFVARLRVSEFIRTDLQFLQDLPPDALHALCLTGNQALNDGWLSEIRALRKIRELDLSNTTVSRWGLRHLVWLDSLAALNLSHTRVHPLNLEDLRRGMPSCEVILEPLAHV